MSSLLRRWRSLAPVPQEAPILRTDPPPAKGRRSHIDGSGWTASAAGRRRRAESPPRPNLPGRPRQRADRPMRDAAPGWSNGGCVRGRATTCGLTSGRLRARRRTRVPTAAPSRSSGCPYGPRFNAALPALYRGFLVVNRRHRRAGAPRRSGAALRDTVHRVDDAASDPRPDERAAAGGAPRLRHPRRSDLLRGGLRGTNPLVPQHPGRPSRRVRPADRRHRRHGRDRDRPGRVDAGVPGPDQGHGRHRPAHRRRRGPPVRAEARRAASLPPARSDPPTGIAPGPFDPGGLGWIPGLAISTWATLRLLGLLRRGLRHRA